MRGFLLLMAVAGGLLMGVLGRTQEASVLPSDPVPASSAGPGESEDNPNPGVLTAQQRERLKGLIPRTFRKLERRDRVHIVALGDSVTRVYTPVPDTSEDFIEGYVAKFGTMLAKRFFYTGGVRMVNAPKGKRQKWDEHLGKEIQVENLAVGGRTAVDALQYLTTTAFLNDPDLVLVNYGINDSKQNLSLDTYRRSLSQVVEECRRRGVDVIVMAPNLIRGFPEPVEWGLTRPYATVAEEVAAENSVFFMDFGKYTASLGGAVPANYESEAAITQVSDRLHTMFHFEAGKPDDDLHPNHETQKFMGSALYENLLNETKATAYKVTAKAHARGEEVVVTLTVRSQVEEDRQVHLCALPVGHWLTATSTNHSFLLAAGKKQEIELIYRTPGQPGSGALEVSTDLGDGLARLSYLIADDRQTELHDCVTRLNPVGVEWISKAMTDVTDTIQIQWAFLNGSKEAVAGQYVFFFGDQKAEGTFELPPVGSVQYFVSFSPGFAKDLLRKKFPVRLEATVNGQKLVYRREMEFTRDIVLGQKVPLQSQSDYAETRSGLLKVAPDDQEASLRIDADETWLYFTTTMPGRNLQLIEDPTGGNPPFALLAEVRLDARPTEECRTFGYVDFLRFQAGVTDGPGTVDRPPLAVFGNGYDQTLDRAGFPVALKTNADGTKRFEFRIPWVYLYRNERKLEQRDGILGLSFSLRLPTPGEAGPQFPPERTWLLNDPGMSPRDARGLVTLRLVTATGLAPSWSARLY